MRSEREGGYNPEAGGDREADELEATLREAAEKGEGKGAGVPPGEEGEPKVEDRPPRPGQTPPV